MSIPFVMRLKRIVVLVTVLLILKITGEVILGYRAYLPPDFRSDFLYGRESYFWGGYHWAFYLHIASGPISLILGLVLINERFRRRFPQWHRRLGRFQAVCVLLVVVPSGLWMAGYASTGLAASVGFVVQSALTALCFALGWRAAVRRKFAIHRKWMWRGFLLLCSAVILRILGGLGTVLMLEAGWINPLFSWASWVIPLGVFEVVCAPWRPARAFVPVSGTPRRF